MIIAIITTVNVPARCFVTDERRGNGYMLPIFNVPPNSLSLVESFLFRCYHDKTILVRSLTSCVLDGSDQITYLILFFYFSFQEFNDLLQYFSILLIFCMKFYSFTAIYLYRVIDQSFHGYSRLNSDEIYLRENYECNQRECKTSK